jgi:hypothetical protein
LAEGRFPRKFFIFFLKSESDISAGLVVKSSRLPDERVILYRIGCAVTVMGSEASPGDLVRKRTTHFGATKRTTGKTQTFRLEIEKQLFENEF